jgi:hypothetical protein
MIEENLFSHCRICSEIQNNDKLGAGAEFVFSENPDYFIVADYQNMKNTFFGKLCQYEDKLESNEQVNTWLRKTLNHIQAEIDFDLYKTLFTIQQIMDTLPLNANYEKERSTLLENAGLNGVLLSELCEKGYAVCAEKSLLSQKYLQNKGIESFLLQGEMDANFNGENIIPEAHTFIFVKSDDNYYIYDPANPKKINETNSYPTIFELNLNENGFNDFIERAKKDIYFIKGKDLLTKQEWFYGVGDNTSVFVSSRFVLDNFKDKDIGNLKLSDHLDEGRT